MPDKETVTELDKLKVFIDEYCLIRRRLLENLHIISGDLHIPEDTIPLNVLGMFAQHIEIAINLFNYYEDNLEGIEDEVWDRINVQERMAFVLILSCFEYVSKPYYQENKARIGLIFDKQRREKKNVSLRDMLKLSNDIRVINDEDYELWKGLLEFRNCTVHNNSISSITKEYISPPFNSETWYFPELKLNLIQGEAVQSNIWLFPHLINWTIDSIENWIRKMHNYKPK